MTSVPLHRYWAHGIDERLIVDAVAAHTGGRPERLIRRPAKAPRIVYEAVLPRGSVIFKGEHATGGDDAIVLEAWACERAREAGAPAPEVLALDAGERTFPGRFAIFERVPGVAMEDLPLSDDDVRRRLRDAGGLLRRIHGVSVDGGYGRLNDDLYLRTGEVRGVRDQWVGQPAALALEYLERERVLDGRECDLVRRLFEAHRAVLRARPESRLLHGELDTSHIFVEPDASRITGVIDFGDREAGDPVWDLTAIGLWEDAERLGYMVEGYGFGPGGLPDVYAKLAIYGFVRLMGVAQRRHAAGRIDDAAPLLARLRSVLNAPEQSPMGGLQLLFPVHPT